MRHPEEQAALGMSPCYFGREIFVQRMQHRIAALAINLANQFDVLVEESVARDFVGNVLTEGGSVQVGGLFQLHQFADHVFGSDDPGQTNSGRERLREGAQVDHVAESESVIAAQIVAVEHHQRRNVLAFVAQLAVGIILDDRDAVLVGQKNELMAASFGKRYARPDSGSWAAHT